MKIYENGTLIRRGVGGLPEIGVSAMSIFEDGKYFHSLMEKIPQRLLGQPVRDQEDTPNGYLEYVIAFYGKSSNGEFGESANWTKSTGLQLKLDVKNGTEHALLPYLDSISTFAIELTNDWYFDVMLKSKYNMMSSALPKTTMIAQPKTGKEIDEQFEIYVNQMLQSAQGWNMTEFTKSKTYNIDENKFDAIVTQTKDSFVVNFKPKNE